MSVEYKLKWREEMEHEKIERVEIGCEYERKYHEGEKMEGEKLRERGKRYGEREKREKKKRVLHTTTTLFHRQVGLLCGPRSSLGLSITIMH